MLNLLYYPNSKHTQSHFSSGFFVPQIQLCCGFKRGKKNTSGFATLFNFPNQIAGAFMSGMINNNGNYSSINLNNLFQTPSFSEVSKPLLALVGGTQQLDIYLSDIKVHGRKYTAKITFWLWDDYGVSADDCVKGGAVRNMTPINDALKAQWILQHNRGYKPLINGFKFTKTISGGF